MDEKQMLEQPAECGGYDFCRPTYQWVSTDEASGEWIPCPCPICGYEAPAAAAKKESTNG